MPVRPPTIGMERKLAAIFSTDVAGYRRLMSEDEEAAIHTLYDVAYHPRCVTGLP